ncbi:MAG: hypothetical protein HPY53_07020 [Brevinematales bacterium]|nr:hypothetical protein [Brevinematales bacterium]
MIDSQLVVMAKMSAAFITDNIYMVIKRLVSGLEYEVHAVPRDDGCDPAGTRVIFFYRVSVSYRDQSARRLVMMGVILPEHG